jgi:D-alanyl-D-alanine carboxypeptidase (penicillin-binding protein 5/6)
LQGARRAVTAALAALALLGGAGSEAGAAELPAPPQLPARAWVLVDAGDGETLAGKRQRGSYPVASTTKLMTAYVARRGLDLDQIVVAPAYAANPAESLLGLSAGERIAVRDLLYGLLLASGNDAAAALAEAAAGSEPRFVARMNKAADKLGLDDTSYANPIGLDEEGNFSSARDLADLAIVLRGDRTFRQIFDSPAATLTSGAQTREIVNRNDLVRTVPEVNGVKTGYTLGAGNVLVASATRDGVTLVSAVLGVASESERDSASLGLLEYGFSLYRERTPVRRGEQLADPEVRFQGEALPLRAVRELRLTVRRDQELTTTVDAPAEVEGPIERGERLGTATVAVDGETVARVGLEAARPVAGATLLERFDGAVPGPRAVAWLVAVAGLGLLFIAAVAIFDRRRGRGRMA